MDYYKEYASKLCSPEEAVRIVKDGDWVDYHQCCSFPTRLDKALAKRKGELKDINVRSAISCDPVAVVEEDPDQETFTYNLWHCSALDRAYIDQGRAYFSPMLFRNIGSYYRRGVAKVDVLMVTVSPMDEHGNFSFGMSNCYLQELVDSARCIILEVNEQSPVVYGIGADHIHISDVDYIVESDAPIKTAPSRPAGEIDKKIASLIFPYLHDGMILQLGIGGMPNALGTLIAQSDLKELGMHTELLSDGYLDLYRAGKITNKNKRLFRGKGVFSTCLGSTELYAYIANNMDILSAPMWYVNAPTTIAGIDDFVSINSCIAMDLYGQVCSESAGLRHISGTGGQLDFVTGAYEGANGRAFLAMPSSHVDKKGIRHSNIKAHFGGDIITTPRAQAPYMVTEYGVANLFGLTTWQRAEAIIGLAHPDFREELIKAAQTQGIWRNSNR